MRERVYNIIIIYTVFYMQYYVGTTNGRGVYHFGIFNEAYTHLFYTRARC